MLAVMCSAEALHQLLFNNASTAVIPLIFHRFCSSVYIVKGWHGEPTICF